MSEYDTTKMHSGRDDPSDRVLTVDQRNRRAVVRQGVKLAFVAPIISTFFARDAYAATYSCSPIGNDCLADGDCCSNNCDTLGTDKCIP